MNDKKIVTIQDIHALLYALLAGIGYAITGAIGGLGTGLAMGSRDWSDLAWGMLIGAVSGYLTRTAEGLRDTQRAKEASVNQTVASVALPDND